MALGDAFKRAANVGRRVAAQLAQRPTAVTIVTETWSAAIGTAGATLSSATTTPLVPAPKVVVAGGAPSLFGDGVYAGPDLGLDALEVRVGPITPAFSGGGYAAATLAPAPVNATQRVYLLLAGRGFATGGERFEIVTVDDTHPQSIYLTARRSKQA